MSKSDKMRVPSLYIVDDDDHFRETFVDVMSLRGISASGSGSAAEAMSEIPALKPSVIVLDVRLPDLHGFELCRKIKSVDKLKDVPVIMISGSNAYRNPGDREEGLEAGADLFLTKPVTMDRLWSEIETLLQ